MIGIQIFEYWAFQGIFLFYFGDFKDITELEKLENLQISF